MSNDGFICCEYCTYNRAIHTNGASNLCDVFGVETNPFTLCRMFRKPKQSQRAARAHWPMLEKLELGMVYRIDNSAYSSGEVEVAYRLVEL